MRQSEVCWLRKQCSQPRSQDLSLSVCTSAQKPRERSQERGGNAVTSSGFGPRAWDPKSDTVTERVSIFSVKVELGRVTNFFHI